MLNYTGFHKVVENYIVSATSISNVKLRCVENCNCSTYSIECKNRHILWTVYIQNRTGRNGTGRKEQVERDRQNRTGRKITCRKRLPGQDCQERTDRTGLPRQDCQDRTARIGLLDRAHSTGPLDKTAMTEQKGEVSQERIEPEWDRQNRTGKKLTGQDCQERTIRTRLSGQDFQNRTARQGCQHNAASTGLLE